ncbi:MAG: hypothetical protein ACPGMR_01910 [Pontibacterium sp.]
MRRTILAVGVVIAAAIAFLFYYQSTQTPAVDQVTEKVDSPANTPADTVASSAPAMPPAESNDTEAKRHISAIKPNATEVIDIEKADHFVSANQKIRIPAATSDATQDMAIIESLEPAGTGSINDNVNVQAIPLDTLNHSTTSASTSSSANSSEPTQSTTARVIDQAVEQVSSTVTQVTNALTGNTTNQTTEPMNTGGTQVPVINAQQHSITITVPAAEPEQVQVFNVASNDGQPTRHQQLPASTGVEVIGIQSSQSGGDFTLNELLNTPENSGEDQVYFIHAVTHDDTQGLWGIVQTGLTQRFAQGIQLSSQSNVIQTHIPKTADERLADNSSSFLGHVLNNKVADIFVYNYKEGRLGDDPNLIVPGQQLVIVRFAEKELVEVYNNFVASNQALN